ncbi:SLC13 family permease [bacterium]|nr:SLC13 family permease [bacterium]
MHKRIGLILGPLVFLFLLLFDIGIDPLKSKVLAVSSWMIIWWVLEVFPIYITAMLPMVFFPSLGIMPIKETFMPYASPIVFLFLGGFLIALAMEERNLHQRIAYGLIRLTGTKPKGILMGFMGASALVAMWISNTATAVMMLPIGISVITLVNDQSSDEKLNKRFGLLLMLAIAYAANIGGTMTLIGTPPNMVFAGFYFEETGADFSFARWMMIGVPVGITLLVLGYLLMTKLVYPISNEPIKGASELFEKRWKSLGKMGRAEKLVLVVFGLTVFCWIMLEPINQWFGVKVLSNTVIAMAGGLLMFFVPVNLKKSEFILHWESTTRLPWGIIILFGGGLTMAAGLQSAGIIDDIAQWVSGSLSPEPLVLVISLTLLSIFLTEVMSNVALVTVLLPVIFKIATQTDVDPLILTIPVTFAASCAFMMPISTPPNAIVYSSGRIGIAEMLKAGIWMNLVAAIVIVVITLAIL